ncbi:MAG: PilZ domain-containing protein [Deltaproteobacteria bacterium]|nr:PilZ domain-containing protein [Deltaproteobacteria bacterium]MBW2419342.1 PilZ domain-containing protein [Deltaproteobacteria bacterium]
MSRSAQAEHVILLAGSNPQHAEELAGRVGAMEAVPVVVPGIDDAIALLRENQVDFGALMVPTHFDAKGLKKRLKPLIAEASPDGLALVSVGPPPAKDQRRQLRGAGFKLALWDPIDDGILRFQLNRALNAEHDGNKRSNPRVPTFLLSRIFVGGREKDAVVYSLSSTGAFLETPRATMDGAEIELEIRIPGSSIRTHAEVVFCNVPGNLQRPKLPLGMGVRFQGLDKGSLKLLRSYVEERNALLEV